MAARNRKGDAGRKVLAGLGLELPLLPTTSVGSFPKPKYITEGWKELKAGKIDAKEMRAREERATVEVIREQEEAGLDVLVDGEMYREDMVVYFANAMAGFEIGGMVRSYGNSFYRKPIINGVVRWRGPITVDWWRFAQRQTKRPVKGMLTGPYTVMDWTFNEHYPSRREATFALAREIAKEVDALIAAGAKVIQIDEPAVSVRPEELPWAVKALKTITEGRRAYFITHICYGAFERIYPGMLKMPFHNFDLELSNSNMDLVKLFRKHPFTKDISFGVTDVHNHRVEDAGLIRERLGRALEALPAEAVWVDPDCGLKTRSHDEAFGKIRNMVEAVRKVRGEKGW